MRGKLHLMLQTPKARSGLSDSSNFKQAEGPAQAKQSWSVDVLHLIRTRHKQEEEAQRPKCRFMNRIRVRCYRLALRFVVVHRKDETQTE